MDPTKGYAPPSPFLQRIVREELALDDESAGAWMRLAHVIEIMLHDPDRANRDWAALMVVGTDLNTALVRDALRVALNDADDATRLEALAGLAKREPGFALPLVAAELARDTIWVLALEAASWLADASLLPALRAIADELDDEDDAFRLQRDEAIACCERGEPPYPWP